MAEQEAMYNLKAVVQRTGIPAASLRAWERRYGVIRPVRKPNGHRVYPESEVAKLLRIKALMAQGMTISQAAAQIDREVEPPPETRTEAERLRAELKAALDDLDGRRANRLFGEALDLFPLEQLCLHVIRPLLADLTPYGRTWMRARLGALLLHAPHYPGAPAALVMAPDPSDLQPLLVAVFLSRRGRNVIYVEGTEQPEGLRPDLVIDPRQWREGRSPAELFG